MQASQQGKEHFRKKNNTHLHLRRHCQHLQEVTEKILFNIELTETNKALHFSSDGVVIYYLNDSFQIVDDLPIMFVMYAHLFAR